MKKILILLAVTAVLLGLPATVAPADFYEKMVLDSKISSLQYEINSLKNELAWLKIDVGKLTARIEQLEAD